MGLATAFVAALVALEMQTSWFQSRVFAAIARQLTFTVAPGPSHAISYPEKGPYDQRLGYASLPVFLHRLESEGYRVEAQARDSKWYLFLTHLGLFPIYHEKSQAGLRITGQDGKILYSARYPQRVYSTFSSIPPLVVKTLRFIENRDILDSRHPYRNPAIEWDRLAKAVFDYGLHEVDHNYHVIGGSTLATQLEKLRHSPGGQTHSVAGKFWQVTSASLRAYEDGPNTLKAQKQIIRDYINSIPMAASTSAGEITGLGDGLWAWYGAGFAKVNHLLATPENRLDHVQMLQRAGAYREVLSLLIALREPSYYLLQNPKALATETNRYLRALGDDGVISARLRDLALRENIRVRSHPPAQPPVHFIEDKAPTAIRGRLMSMLGISSAYDLDHLDLTAATTIARGTQNGVTGFLVKLKKPGEVNAENLRQVQLLSQGDPRSVIYSFTLYEHGHGVNLLRVQADNYNGPLSINQGTKLQLGSTAKLRTLINYLQIIRQLHDTYAGLPPSRLAAVKVFPGDNLTSWAVQYLETNPDKSLTPMLEAALDRRYSASTAEGFFTGGGVQHFVNFESSDNGRIIPVREAFERSVNLVFIRLLRDIVHYYRYRVPGASPSVLTDPNNPARRGYLERFADQEGRVFLTRFYNRFKGKTPDQALEALVNSIHATPLRVAVIYRSVKPDDGLGQFSTFLRAHVPTSLLTGQDMQKLYEKYGPYKFNLSDRGYLAHVHPLELWLLHYREGHPQAGLTEILAKSAQQRQEVYRWLFRTRYKSAQDPRIRILLEEDAFKDIYKDWKKLGYPFDSLVPSYATAIGVSGDTPAALAKLAGIIQNGGVLYPSISIRQLHFAQGTPMETDLTRQTGGGRRVLSPEIASLVRQVMIGVVQNGTGRRVRGAYNLPNGTEIPVGGKTGTGDNRFQTFAAGGRLISWRVVNRTAAFVFIIGHRFFGTVMAFVPGKQASHYRFTSALAVQILRDLKPRLLPFIERAEQGHSARSATAS